MPACHFSWCLWQRSSMVGHPSSEPRQPVVPCESPKPSFPFRSLNRRNARVRSVGCGGGRGQGRMPRQHHVARACALAAPPGGARRRGLLRRAQRQRQQRQSLCLRAAGRERRRRSLRRQAAAAAAAELHAAEAMEPWVDDWERAAGAACLACRGLHGGAASAEPELAGGLLGCDPCLRPAEGGGRRRREGRRRRRGVRRVDREGWGVPLGRGQFQRAAECDRSACGSPLHSILLTVVTLPSTAQPSSWLRLGHPSACRQGERRGGIQRGAREPGCV